MITILDLDRKPTAILEAVTQIGYVKKINTLSRASFTIPSKNDKVKHIKPMHYADIHDDETDEHIGLFRILPKTRKSNTLEDTTSYSVEHVLGTLLSSTMFKYHQMEGFTTRQVIQKILDMQNVKHWVLGDVEFTRYFHYSWENENLLSALFSVPKPFDEEYVWETDTKQYPWKLHLRKPKTTVSSRVIESYNLKGFTVEENPNAMYNRIYPLGSGEGVNQVDIKSVNGGIPYLENPSSIAIYGRHDTVWADRRFEDAQSLKDSAKALLDSWSVPTINWDVNVMDVSKLTGISADKIRQGMICRISIDGMSPVDLKVIEESKDDLLNKTMDLSVVLGNSKDSLNTTYTDLERRQQINELYSQGATNILNFSYQDNCDNTRPATIPFYIDNDVVNVNAVELNFRTKPFRAYSGTTKSGGSSTQTSTSGGSVSKSTSSGGSSTKTSTSAGESTRTSTSNGLHNHNATMLSGDLGAYTGTPRLRTMIFGGPGGFKELAVLTPDTVYDTGMFQTYSSNGEHTHNVTTPAHTHSVDIPAHTHGFEIPNHSHSVDIPSHEHDIKHEIVEATERASNVVIKIDGNIVPHDSLTGTRIDLTSYMSKNSDGTVTRGRHEITITPDKIARIEADVILRVFIRSHLGVQL